MSFNYLALSIIRKYVQNVLKPLKKMKISEEIAEVIWQTANTPVYMTGQIIGVDGGYI